MSGQWHVRAVELGRWTGIPGPELFWMSNWAEKREIALLSVIAVNDAGDVAVVNTGPDAEDLVRMNAMWAAGVGADCQLTQTGSVLEALSEMGLTAESVKWVFCTPFQAYTVGNVTAFPQARICLSRKGWRFFFENPYPNHPHDYPPQVFPPAVLHHLIYEARERILLLDDEHAVAPGLATRFTGAHHRASIGVSFTTAVGEVVVSDSAFLYENLEPGRLLGINESMYEALDAYAWFRSVDAFVPLYDPQVLVRYPGGVIT